LTGKGSCEDGGRKESNDDQRLDGFMDSLSPRVPASFDEDTYR
jgi:hypothetical protein